MEPITKIAEKAGIDDKYLEQYGKYKAKIDYNLLKESDAPNGFLNVSKVENQCDLEKVFSEYLKNGRNIPKGQKHAIETLTHCQTKEDFWRVINTLFKCDARVYRSPVIDYLNENDISQFMPNKEILSSVCEQLFSIEDKPEKNIEFLYHFKDILTDEIKEKMEKTAIFFLSPMHITNFAICLEWIQMNLLSIVSSNLMRHHTIVYMKRFSMFMKKKAILRLTN